MSENPFDPPISQGRPSGAAAGMAPAGSMVIADRVIGPDQPPLVIVEIGINHGGDLDVAREMVRLAAASGAEYNKPQAQSVAGA